MRVQKITLTDTERSYLINFTKKGKRLSKEIERAYILLALDKGKRVKNIEDFYNVSRVTIWRVKKKYKKYGVERAIKDDMRAGQPVKYKEKENAEVVAMACTKAPDGRIRWTLDLLTKALKQQQGLESINRETIRLILKKTNVSLG